MAKPEDNKAVDDPVPLLQQRAVVDGAVRDLASPTPATSKVKPKEELPPTAHSIVLELYLRFIAGECFTRAQALAFVGIVSLVPVLLCALTVLSFVISDPRQVIDYIHSISRQLLPGAEATKAADAFILQTNIVGTARTLMQGKWWAITIGIGSFVWTTISLLACATEPMNVAWQVKETRSFVRLRVVCLGVVVLTILLFALSLALTSGPAFIQNLTIPWLGLPRPAPFWLELIFEAAAWGIDIAMFALLYKVLPDTRVPWRASLFGGVIAGLLWELFKKGFATFLSHFSTFNKFYGTLGGLFLLLTWIYYSCVVLLAGAIISKMYAERNLSPHA